MTADVITDVLVVGAGAAGMYAAISAAAVDHHQHTWCRINYQMVMKVLLLNPPICIQDVYLVSLLSP